MILEIRLRIHYCEKHGAWEVIILDRYGKILEVYEFNSKHRAELFADDYTLLFSGLCTNGSQSL